MTVTAYDVLVVGAGPAGLAVAESYRDHGGSGRIAVVGADPDPPYSRPALSKEFLRGEVVRSDLELRESAFFGDHDIELRVGCEVDALDPASGCATLAGGEKIRFRDCVLATGARPAKAPVPVPAGAPVSTLRERSDSETLAESAAGDLLVVGSGFIGCEAAASIAMRGGRVTMATMEPVPQAVRLGEEVGHRIAGWLRELGIELLTDATLERLDAGPPAQASFGERTVSADRILLALGVEPRAELAAECGIELRHGRVPVDSRMRSGLAGLRAVGDVCLAENSTAGRPLQVEHWGEALNQGGVAGAHLAGDGAAEWDGAPGFWTTIGERTLKYVAWGDGFDDIRIDERPDGGFVATYGLDGRIVGVLTHGDDDAYEQGRELVESGATW
ncbi:MAG: FAD/NAD(P)-binding oxidoreductase [Solirubrobacterales bacterium]